MDDRKLWLGSVVVTVIGLLDSVYLTWSKLTAQPVFCGQYGGCESVNNSPYAEIAGIPIAILGAGAYLTVLALLYLERQGGFWASNGPLLVFGISLAGTLYSAYLTYIEVAVIHAVCFYCVISAVAILLLLILTLIRLARGQEEYAST